LLAPTATRPERRFEEHGTYDYLAVCPSLAASTRGWPRRRWCGSGVRWRGERRRRWPSDAPRANHSL